MKKLRETLRLKFEAKLNNRAIARSLSISASTVSCYTRAMNDADLTYPDVQSLNDAALTEKLLPYCRQRQTMPEECSFPEPDYSTLHKAMKQKGVNLQLLWEEYCEQYSNQKHYSYSQFCRLYRNWHGSLEPVLRHHYVAGEHCFIDFCGPKIPIYNADNTVAFEAYVFVAALGASQYTYAEALRTRSLEDWIGAHVRLFSYLGGVPAILVPDNEKSAVKEASYYEPDINLTYADLAEYYNTAVIPARPLKPKDKAIVEKIVQCIETYIIAKLRHYKFTSLPELNDAIKPLLKEFNEKVFQKLNYSRADLFKTWEQNQLLPLPEAPYVLARFSKQLVNLNYHVYLDEHYYSVPHQYIRKTVLGRIKPNIIEVFYQNELIASHLREFTKGKYSTKSEHMPEAHRYKTQWTIQTFLDWAQGVDGVVLQQVKHILENEHHPERLYRLHNGFKKLIKGYCVERFINACAYANQNNLTSYKSLSAILKNKLDQCNEMQCDSSNDEASFKPSNGHENVRGHHYYA